MSYLLELVDEADKNKDGKIDFDEWEIMGVFRLVCSSVLQNLSSSEQLTGSRRECPWPRRLLKM